MASNLPPGGGFGIDYIGEVPQFCINKHHWQAEMLTELGGCFYARDDDSDCPQCDETDIRNTFTELLSPEERIMQAQLLKEESC